MRIWRSCTNNSLHTGAGWQCPSPRMLPEGDERGRREMSSTIMSSTIRPMEQFVKTLLAARRVSTPLVAIRTADPALTVARIEEAVGKDAAIVQWDIVRGLVRVNDAVLVFANAQRFWND